MAKDPAFLFYPGDWLGGTMGMSLEEKGAYIEMLVFQFNRGKFSNQQALSLLRDSVLWDTIRIKFKEENGFYWNERLELEKNKRNSFVESRRQSRLKSDEDNVRIYIVRDNVRLTYKIGSSVNPTRRYNELSNQINPAIMGDTQGNRNISLIWYSDPVLRIEEKKLHKLFKNKNIEGEWFSLNQEDLDFITNKNKGTFVERTLDRTENRNEIGSLLESNTNTSISSIKNKPIPVVQQMIGIYLESFPKYFRDDEKDFSACFSITQKVENLKGWSRGACMNGKMEEFMLFWREVVDYVKGDDWLSGRSLTDLSTREWQRLGQHMSKEPKERKKNKKEESMSNYEKELHAKREAMKNRKEEV